MTNMIYGINPATNEQLSPGYPVDSQDEINQKVQQSRSAYAMYSRLPGTERAKLLRTIADEIEGLPNLIPLVMSETALPEARITGERGRTCVQLRMFAEVAEEGSWVDARIDHAIPDRQPLPKPDLRRMLVALGPVAVFGASNFPLAFSVAGGDTASCLAAGCPVIVKGHPSHPGTSAMIADAINRATKKCKLPNGVFSLVQGEIEAGRQLVLHPAITAVAFTGSLATGRSLMDLAAQRTHPIPVFAEMGSINPVFLLPGAESPEFAQNYVASLTMGCGQFCTNPGVLVGIASPEFDQMVEQITEIAAQSPPGVMLNAGIQKNYHHLVEQRSLKNSVAVRCSNGAVVFETSAQDFVEDPELHAELFGPACLIVRCLDQEEMNRVAESLEGQLTGSVFGYQPGPADELISVLTNRVGRLIFGAFPTGVEVCDAMHHGGPYPAASDSRFTSVGRAAIMRWARPVCWQNAPDSVLPAELQNANPLGIWRRIDSMFTNG